MHSVQCTVYSVQCTVHSSLYSVGCALLGAGLKGNSPGNDSLAGEGGMWREGNN